MEAIEDDLPDSLQKEIKFSIQTLQSDLSNTSYQGVIKFPTIYLEELLKLENRVLTKKPRSAEYIRYLNSLPSMKEKMRDISIRYRDEMYIHQIKEYFESILKDPEIQDKDKNTILIFLYENSFPLSDELIPVLKDLLGSELLFMEKFLDKLTFTDEEYHDLLKHPNENVRRLAIRKINLNLKETQELLKEFQIFRGIEPIVVIDGNPINAGIIAKDLRFLKILNGYDKTRFKILSSTRRVIKLEYNEFKKVSTYIMELRLAIRGIKPEILQQKAKYFLLIDDRLKYPINFGNMDFGDSLSVKDIMDPKNYNKE